MTTSAERIGAVSGAPRITFLVDRESDSAAMLCTLAATKHDFIVRGNWDRTVRAADGRSWKVRTLMGHEKQLGSYDVELAGGPGRAARVAHVTLRAVDVLVPLKDPTTGKRREVKVSAINAREMVSCPTGEESLDWLLLTNLRVENFAQAREVVSTYALRWRIEEFHRTWKSIHCNVEDSHPCRRFQCQRKSQTGVPSTRSLWSFGQPTRLRLPARLKALALASDIEAVWVASDALARLRGSDPVAAAVVDFVNERLRRGR